MLLHRLSKAPSRLLSRNLSLLKPSTALSGLPNFKQDALAQKLQLAKPDLLRYTNYVDGGWVTSLRDQSNVNFEIRDPATDELVRLFLTPFSLTFFVR